MSITMEEIGVLVLLSVFSVVGTIGNSLVLYIYAKKKEKSTAGIFIMSLAGTDLFTCLVIVPYTEVAIALDYKLHFDAVCKIYMFLITCNIPFSAFVMVAIAIDRYFCICRPFLHAINLQRAKAIVMCLLMLASTLGVITSLSHGVYIVINNEQANTAATNFTDETNTQYQFTFGNMTDFNKNSTEYFVDNRTFTETFEKGVNTSLMKNSSGNDSIISSYSYTITHVKGSEFQLVYTGVCMFNTIVFDNKFSRAYQKVYAGFYLVSFCAVLILYGLIYKSIHKHRAKKSKRKRSSLYPAGVEFSVAETQITAVTHVNPHGNGACASPDETVPMQRQRKVHKPMSIKEKTLLANIRTAAMLFVVTIVFLVAFLPAWLMAIEAVTFNMFIFYMYFVYNTANPFIYAFMNKSFRDDLGKVMKCQSVPMVR